MAKIQFISGCDLSIFWDFCIFLGPPREHFYGSSRVFCAHAAAAAATSIDSAYH